MNASKNNKTCPLCKAQVSKRELVEEKGLEQLLDILIKHLGQNLTGTASKEMNTKQTDAKSVYTIRSDEKTIQEPIDLNHDSTCTDTHHDS